ncbi:ATP-binding cassette domain-containing protein [Alloyangia pacifica]|uniref:Ribose transport system ATP-binding protein n=1 Tax=Alloyangia pacifica TaxID=311180 RepID=A0A1I6VH30_9RHOB|nr:ATP-binding cassette domain-containing protein [Alloyangia pacifica]SDH97493.1 ribose transport system ATP-binding protein [Alloyangia pacifica]SFT12947.1 ribose transport system ATP-binding protein [Alloyangia pacifica]
MPIPALLKRNETVLFLLLALAVAVFGLIDPRFLAPTNLVSIAQQSAIIAIIAFAMTAVIISRGIDISVGSMLAASGIVAGLMLATTGSALVAIVSALLTGAALGAINGVLVGLAGVSPFITTLATMALARGLALSLSNSSSIMVQDPVLLFLGSARLGAVPVSVVFAAVCFAVWWFVLNRTVYGRWLFAVGGNPTAAAATGIPVRRVQISVYALSGVFAALGTIVAIGRLGSAQPLAGTGLEFTAITAAIIGGTRLSGGWGSMVGTALGAILLGVINTGLSFMQVPQTLIYFVTAALILLAVLISQPESLKQLVVRRRKRVEPSAQAAPQEIAAGSHHEIELNGLGKIFPGVKALDGVTFRLRSGEVVALAGENGAGKSTLVKCLSGIYRPDEGHIRLDGRALETAAAFERAGISVIHQHFSLSPDLTVVENMFLGREPVNALGMLDRSKMLSETRRILDELQLRIDPTAPLGLLTVGEQQMVEIARAVLSNAWMFIMDEPTSALSNRERDKLYEIMAMLRTRGAGILYISHKMEEIFTQCDRVLVLRDGVFVGEREVAKTDEAEIISMMVGREIDDVFAHREVTAGAMAVEVTDLSDGKRLKSASLTLREGEIVALAGLMGSGRSEVLRCIAGLSTPASGEMRLFGQPLGQGAPEGVVYIPEDRHLEGFVGPMSIRDNLSLAWIRAHSRWGLLNPSKLDALAKEQIAQLGVRPPQPDKLVGQLSGGNQQKVVIGKWLVTKPRVVLLDEPTRGVDVGAKSELHRLIADLKAQGVAILMVSSELPEVLGVADRIVVMAEGRSVGELGRGATEQDIMRLAFAHPSADIAAE